MLTVSEMFTWLQLTSNCTALQTMPIYGLYTVVMVVKNAVSSYGRLSYRQKLRARHAILGCQTCKCGSDCDIASATGALIQNFYVAVMSSILKRSVRHILKLLL